MCLIALGRLKDFRALRNPHRAPYATGGLRLHLQVFASSSEYTLPAHCSRRRNRSPTRGQKSLHVLTPVSGGAKIVPAIHIPLPSMIWTVHRVLPGVSPYPTTGLRTSKLGYAQVVCGATK